MGTIGIIIVMCMRVIQSTYSKKAALSLPDGMGAYMKYIAVSKLFSTLFALALIIPTMNFANVNSQSLIIASCSGICLAVNSICGVKALRNGTIALSSIFGTAGMIIPIILGIFVFDEMVTPIQVICILVLFVAIYMLVDTTKKTVSGFSLKTLVYLVGSLLSNGMVMFCQKLFGELQPDGNVSMFSMFTFMIPTIVLGVMLLFMKTADGGGTVSFKLEKRTYGYALALAFAVFVIQQVVTMLTPIIPAAVLFTLVNGGATVIAAIVGAVLYKEKITLKSGTAIGIGLAALIIIKIFG